MTATSPAGGGPPSAPAGLIRALAAWDERARLIRPAEPADDGVWLARVHGRRTAVRASRHAAAALEWELDLLDHLAGAGLRVPAPLRTGDGRRHVDGVVVAPWLDGHPPRAKAEWEAVVATLGAVHAATLGWPQRPGFAACADLPVARRGGDVDLDALPGDLAALCEPAWAALGAHEPAAGTRSVVHGCPGRAGNLRLVGEQVALLGWDAARVDHPQLDLVGLTLPPAQQPPPVVRRAHLAREVAARWPTAPAAARRRAAALAG